MFDKDIIRVKDLVLRLIVLFCHKLIYEELSYRSTKFHTILHSSKAIHNEVGYKLTFISDWLASVFSSLFT